MYKNPKVILIMLTLAAVISATVYFSLGSSKEVGKEGGKSGSASLSTGKDEEGNLIKGSDKGAVDNKPGAGGDTKKVDPKKTDTKKVTRPVDKPSVESTGGADESESSILNDGTPGTVENKAKPKRTIADVKKEKEERLMAEKAAEALKNKSAQYDEIDEASVKKKNPLTPREEFILDLRKDILKYDKTLKILVQQGKLKEVKAYLKKTNFPQILNEYEKDEIYRSLLKKTAATEAKLECKQECFDEFSAAEPLPRKAKKAKKSFKIDVTKNQEFGI